MKKLALFFLALLPALVFAENPPHGKLLNDSEESMKLSLYIPGFLVKTTSWFVDKEKDPVAKEILSKLRSTSIVLREGNAYRDYFANKKFHRKMQLLQHQHFEELVSAISDEGKISVQLRQNRKGSVRQVVIIADDGEETFVFLRVRCNVTMYDVQRWLKSNEDVRQKIENVVDL